MRSNRQGKRRPTTWVQFGSNNVQAGPKTSHQQPRICMTGKDWLWVSLNSGPGGRRFKSSLPDQYLQQLAILATLQIEPLVRLLWVPQSKCRSRRGLASVDNPRIDWIRAKARFELSMLLVRTKTAGQKGAFAHDDYRM